MLLAASIGAGCGDDDEDPFDPAATEFSAVVDFRNLDDLAVHIFAPGEDFPCSGEDFPCCRLNEAISGPTVRNASMTLKNGQRYTFRAGRNGAILRTVSCESNGRPDLSHSVEFRNGNLTCGAAWN